MTLEPATDAGEPKPLSQVVEIGGVGGVLGRLTPALRTRRAGLGAWSGDGAQPGEGGEEAMLPGPTLGEVEGLSAGRAGAVTGQREQAATHPLGGGGGGQLVGQAESHQPAGQVVG